MAKTIKQIADELGVSKTAVNKKINNLGLRLQLSVVGNQFMVNEEQETLIKQAFSGKKSQTVNRKPPTTKSATKSQTSDMVGDVVSVLEKQLEMLNQQLEKKDKQIENLTEMLAKNQELLNQEQHLNLLNQEKILMLTEQTESKKETIEENVIVEEKENVEVEKPKGFFKRLFSN